VMTVFLALAGLAYVYLTLQLYHLGERRKAVENELALLRTQNDVAAGQIAALTSRTTLQRRLKEGYLKMIPVSESKIVRLTVPARPTDEEAIQPVVNTRLQAGHSRRTRHHPGREQGSSRAQRSGGNRRGRRHAS
jgi:hypothetical protein